MELAGRPRLSVTKIATLRNDFKLLADHLSTNPLTDRHPWNALYEWAKGTLSLEGQEQLISLTMEPHSDLVDELADTMSADEDASFHIDGAMTVAGLKKLMKTSYDWALSVDFGKKEAIARVWYVSEEKLEPRLGERFDEPIEPYEQPLAPGRNAAAMFDALQTWDDTATVAKFLMQHPEHRQATRRAQLSGNLPFAEIHDNMIAADMLPIDLLRCKISFFGATKFDPRSDRWVRITMFQGAPFPDELSDTDPDDLAYPPLTAS